MGRIFLANSNTKLNGSVLKWQNFIECIWKSELGNQKMVSEITPAVHKWLSVRMRSENLAESRR